MPLDSRVGEFCMSCGRNRVVPLEPRDDPSDPLEPGWECTACGAILPNCYLPEDAREDAA